MKQLLLTLGILNLNLCWSLQTINLNQQNFSCNKLRLTTISSESTLQTNCHQVHYIDDKQIISGQNAGRLRGSDQIYEIDPDPAVANLTKLWFYTDDGTQMRCYYRNNIQVKCQIKSTKN